MTEKSAHSRRGGARGVVAAFSGILAAGALAVGIPLDASASAHSSETAAQLFHAALTSSAAARSFLVKGTVDIPKENFAVDLTVGAARMAEGSLTINGGTVQIVEIGNTSYFKADTTFWTQNAGATAAQLLAGKWVYGPTSSSPFSGFKGFLSPRGFIKLFFNSDQGPFTKSAATTVDGTHVIPVMANGPGTLYVAAASPHVIISAQGSKGSSRASLSFSQYGRAVHPSAPAGGISLKALEAAGS